MNWPRKHQTYWCVCDSNGTAYLSTARVKRSRSIAAWLAETDPPDKQRDWRWWRRAKFTCQRLDVKVRNAV